MQKMVGTVGVQHCLWQGPGIKESALHYLWNSTWSDLLKSFCPMCISNRPLTQNSFVSIQVSWSELCGPCTFPSIILLWDDLHMYVVSIWSPVKCPSATKPAMVRAAGHLERLAPGKRFRISVLPVQKRGIEGHGNNIVYPSKLHSTQLGSNLLHESKEASDIWWTCESVCTCSSIIYLLMAVLTFGVGENASIVIASEIKGRNFIAPFHQVYSKSGYGKVG